MTPSLFMCFPLKLGDAEVNGLWASGRYVLTHVIMLVHEAF